MSKRLLYSEAVDVEAMYCLFLNGKNKILSIDKMFIGEHIKCAGLPKRDHKMVRRNDTDFDQVFKSCYEHASYLAKAYTKGESSKGVREYGISQL